MDSECAAAWAQAEAARQRLTDRVAGLTPQQQVQRPDLGSFSPTEALEHMALTDAMYLPWVIATDNRKPGGANFILSMVVRRMQSGKRTPTVKKLEPRAMPTLADADAHWARVRLELQKQLEGARADLGVIRHPLFGRMRLPELTRLLEAHTVYHEKRLGF